MRRARQVKGRAPPRIGALAALLASALAACLPRVPADDADAGTRPRGPERLALASCEAHPDARGLDELRRGGIAARVCRVAPGLSVSVLQDDATSWPVVQDGLRPPVSLEDPLALRQWFPRSSAVHVSFERGEMAVVHDAAGAPRSIYYSGFADRTDAPGSIGLFVAIRVRPSPCVLGVVREAAEARRLAEDDHARCLTPTGVR